MASPIPPLPDRPEPLSPAEQRALAELEDQFSFSEGQFGGRMVDGGWTTIHLAPPAWLTTSRAGRALVLAALLAGLLLVPVSVWAVLALFATLVGLPLLLLQGTERDGRG